MTRRAWHTGGRGLAVPLLTVLLGVPAVQAQDADEADPGNGRPEAFGEVEGITPPRNRLDFSLAFLDTLGLDSLHFVFGYTYSLTPNANLSLTLPIVDGDVAERGGYGLGDLELAVSFTPFLKIAANPWVPKTVGTGLVLLLPTGDPNQDRGLGAFVLNPFVGGVLPLSDSFFLLPQVAYSHSFHETSADVDIRLGTVSVGLTFVSFNGFWVGPLVEFVRDFDTDETAVNYDIIVGKEFSSGLGVSVQYFDFELLNPATGAGVGKTGDRLIAVNLHLTF